MGYLPSRLRERHGSWLGFVAAEGDLSEAERRVFDRHVALLRELETTNMTRSFKMVTLHALLEHDALVTGMAVPELARRAHEIVRRSPELFSDVAPSHRFETLDAASERRWQAYWRDNPIQAWTGAEGRAWFRLDGERFVLDVEVEPEDQLSLAALTRELVDYRLAQYRRRSDKTPPTEGFTCKVTWNKRDPILKLPKRRDALPEADTDVRLSDGSVWVFRFTKEYCNVARPAGSSENKLPDLLRRWFGPSAGQPGTAFQVVLRASPDGLWAEPERGLAPLIELPRRAIRAYPDLHAAAGHAVGAADVVEAAYVSLPLGEVEPDQFAVRVAGTSMDGGRAPLRDGDWAVFRLARGAPASSIENRVALVQTDTATTGHAFQIKRVVRREGKWWLSSDNPEGPQLEASVESVVIARLDRAFHPEELAPEVGAVLDNDDLPSRFGLGALEPRSGRHEGHLFLFVDRPAMLVTAAQVRHELTRQPGETAFVIARRADGAWRYLGVGRVDEEGLWRIPEVDHETWTEWGTGRGVSRALPRGVLERAEQAARVLTELPVAEQTITQPNGRTARIAGFSSRGGLRIESPGGAFEPRTVSLIDLAWAIAASDDRDQRGGLLDEERVNRLRYLEGTPKGSTRWIDTAWALAAWAKAKPLMPATSGVTQLHDEGGQPIDARFAVEQRSGQLHVVVEARGGTKGSKDERNTEYARGLELLLTRLRAIGARLDDAHVDSSSTRALSPDQRRLTIEGKPYPLTIDNPAELRRALMRAAAKLRKPGAKGGGNQTKRIRLVVEGLKGVAVGELANRLAGR